MRECLDAQADFGKIPKAVLSSVETLDKLEDWLLAKIPGEKKKHGQWSPASPRED